MSRRGYGAGTIFPYRDGWRALVELPRVEGKRRRRVIDGATRREVQEELNDALHQKDQGTLATGRSQSVSAFVAKWLVDVDVEESTRVSYAQKLAHVTRAFGTTRVRDLTGQQLDGFFAAKRKSLSPQSVKEIRSDLHNALETAVDYGLIATNPVKRTRPIKVPRFRATYLDPEQALRFLKCAAGDRLEALYWVVLTLGLRQGEVLGLRWSDLDLEARTWTVTHQLQRRKGEGLVLKTPKDDEDRGPWPMAKVTAIALRAHRARQNAERLAAGALWQDNDLVFCTLEGRPLSASQIVSNNRTVGSFRRICERAGVTYSSRKQRGLRFHDLRHSAGSVLYAYKVPIKTISEVLGHSKIDITANRYVHVSQAVMQEAADAMDRAFGGSR